MSAFANRVISIYNRKTSMRLSTAEWNALDAICKKENISRKQLLELIDTCKSTASGLTSAVRLFALTYFRTSYQNQTATLADIKTNVLREALKAII